MAAASWPPDVAGWLAGINLFPEGNSVKLPACRGAVAQLGERRVRNAEAGSSILPGSTT